jgi:glucokinase
MNILEDARGAPHADPERPFRPDREGGGMRRDEAALAWLCIDLGFTFTRFGVWRGERFVAIERVRTIDTKSGPYASGAERRDAWLQWLAGEVDRLRALWPGLSRVGLCFPGIVTADGAMWRASSIWGTAGDDLPAARLEQAFGLPVLVLNDLSAAAVRYGEDPAMADQQTVAVVSISSGIGAKLYDREARRVMLEPGGRNGELGLAVVDEAPDALTNSEGQLRGILGHYAAGVGFACMVRRAATAAGSAYPGSALRRRLDEAGEDIAAVDRVRLNELAVLSIREGDGFVREVLRTAIGYLVRALHIVILFNAPGRVVLTGGFAISVGEAYREEVCAALAPKLRLLYTPEEIAAMVVMGAEDDMDNLLGMASWMTRHSAPAVARTGG